MTFESSPSTEKLDAALAKAQGKFKVAKKNAMNPHFGKAYADLSSVWEACREPLSENGISVTQWPLESPPGRLTLMTRIAHGGEWMRSTYSMPLSKQDAHGVGGAITYAKRFALGAIVGVASEDEDDDGNAASGGSRRSSQPGNRAPQGQSSKPAGKPAEPKKQTFKEFLNSVGWDEAQAQEWVTLKFNLQEGQRSTPEMLDEFKKVALTTPPDQALFLVRDPR